MHLSDPWLFCIITQPLAALSGRRSSSGATASTPSWPHYGRLDGWLDGHRWQRVDLLDQKGALVDELLVVGAVMQERCKEFEELVLIVEEDALHGDGFMGIGHEDLLRLVSYIFAKFDFWV